MYYLHILDYSDNTVTAYRYSSKPMEEDLAETVEGLGHDINTCEWLLNTFPPSLE